MSVPVIVGMRMAVMTVVVVMMMIRLATRGRRSGHTCLGLELFDTACMDHSGVCPGRLATGMWQQLEDGFKVLFGTFRRPRYGND